MKRLEILLLPPDGMLVHDKVILSIMIFHCPLIHMGKESEEKNCGQNYGKDVARTTDLQIESPPGGVFRPIRARAWVIIAYGLS